MNSQTGICDAWWPNRRTWLQHAAWMGCLSAWPSTARSHPRPTGSAKIAITLDLEMARNFPNWEDTHWDYEKGNLNTAAKDYALRAGEVVNSYGGRIHYFLVASALEQAEVGWLQELIRAGHPLGNHTYDHVNLLAQKPADIQYKFQRAPWLIDGQSTLEVIRQNIVLAQRAMRDRLGIDHQGFRTPGGFQHGLSDREDLQNMLLDLGFTWVSSKYPAHLNTQPQTRPSEAVIADILDAQRRAQPFIYPTGLIEVPMSPISDIGAFRNGRWTLEWFLEVIQRVVAQTIEQGGVFDFLAHPSCLGVVDPQLKTIGLICDMVREAGDKAQLVDLEQIAQTISPTTSEPVPK